MTVASDLGVEIDWFVCSALEYNTFVPHYLCGYVLYGTYVVLSNPARNLSFVLK